MRSILLAAVLALWGFAAHADTPTLVDFATVSMSAPGMPRTVTDTVCVTDGRDLTCDRGVYITSDSRVGIGTNNPSSPLHVQLGNNSMWTSANWRRVTLANSGNSAIQFGYGGGTRWGIGWDQQIFSFWTATGDDTSVGPGYKFGIDANGNLAVNRRITSNTLGVYGNASIGTGYQLTPAPTNGLIVQNQVGIGTSAPSTSLHVSGTLRLANGGEACDANRTGAIRYTGGDFSFCRNGSSWETLTSLAGGGGLSDRITSGTSAVVVNSATGIVSISQLGAVASYVHPSLGYVGPGVSATGTVSASKVATNEVLLSNTGGLCSTAADVGRMFRSPTTGKLQVCAERN